MVHIEMTEEEKKEKAEKSASTWMSRLGEAGGMFRSGEKADLKKIKEIMYDFAQKQGSNHELTGSLTNALLERYKDSKGGKTEGTMLCELSISLNQKFEEFRNSIDKIVGRENKVTNVTAFANTIISSDMSKGRDNILSIGAGELNSTQVYEVMERLLKAYKESDFSSEIGNKIGAVNHQLALLNRESEFKKAKL
jgi:hypothetical protein